MGCYFFNEVVPQFEIFQNKKVTHLKIIFTLVNGARIFQIKSASNSNRVYPIERYIFFHTFDMKIDINCIIYSYVREVYTLNLRT